MPDAGSIDMSGMSLTNGHDKSRDRDSWMPRKRKRPVRAVQSAIDASAIRKIVTAGCAAAGAAAREDGARKRAGSVIEGNQYGIMPVSQ